MQNPLILCKEIFWAQCCALQNVLLKPVRLQKKQLEQHVNFESGRWFLCANTHTKVCGCVELNASVCVSLNLCIHSKKKMRDFNSYHEQRMNEQSMGRWDEENRWQRREEFDIHRWWRQFYVVKLHVGDIKGEKGNKTN